MNTLQSMIEAGDLDLSTLHAALIEMWIRGRASVSGDLPAVRAYLDDSAAHYQAHVDLAAVIGTTATQREAETACRGVQERLRERLVKAETVEAAMSLPPLWQKPRW